MLVLKPFTRGSWSVDAAACAWHQSPSWSVFRDGSVKTILAKSHEASSGRTPPDTSGLPAEASVFRKVSEGARPHFASRRRTRQPLPQVARPAFNVLAPAN